jgi:hypothetical protein
MRPRRHGDSAGPVGMIPAALRDRAPGLR